MKKNKLLQTNKLISSLILLTMVSIIFSCKNNSEIEIHDKTEKEIVTKEKWHWDTPSKQNESAGYSQVVKVGNTIYISGVPARDINPEGISKLYNTLEKCLNSFGATSKDVVKETLYTTDIEAMKTYNSVRKNFYKGDYPAASWVQIDRLYNPEAKLEVDLIAVLTNSEK